jgi:DNA-binding NtrC family response regulator
MNTAQSASLNLAVNALVVSPFEGDYASLRNILSHSNWILNRAAGCREALAVIQRLKISVVVCERDLPDGNWKMLLEATAALPHPPRLIVSSHAADDRLWMDVLGAGGYDLVLVPFEGPEVLRAISLASQSWHREQRPAYAPPKPPKYAAAASLLAG